MSVPSCLVTVHCYKQDGSPDPGAKVSARLNHAEVYQGYIVPQEVEATADASGVATLTLFRNALGSTGSMYKIRIEGTSGGVVKTTATVPDQATANLQDIANLPAYPGKSDGQFAVDQAGAYASAADNSAKAAASSATQAGNSATQAGNSATQAAGSKTAIDNRIYPGVYAQAPSTRPDGSARQNGDRCVVNDGTNTLEYIFSGTLWVSSAEAANSAIAAETARAGAESALAQVQSIVSATPGSTVAALAGDETDALVFDVSETDPLYEARKVVAGTGTFGTLQALGVLTYGLKIVVKEDGSWQWNRHQLLYRTDNLADTSQWIQSNCTPTAGYTDSKGTTKAFKLTATGAVASIRQVRSINRENWFSFEAVFRNNDSGWAYVELYDNTTHRLVYINLATGALGNSDSNFTANVYTTDADGNALPAGFTAVKITACWPSATSVTVYVGPCDANGSTAVTSGKSCFVEFPLLHYGSHRQAYLENTSTTGGFYEAPYDYATGKRRVKLEPTTTYISNYSEDLTQADWVKTATMGVQFDATGAGPLGPSGSPCSRLTAGFTNDTIMQAVSGGTARVANFAIKRVTGSGAVYITIDGGVTWRDVTSDLSTTKFTRFALAGGANSNFGFKIATAGDAIDVAFNLLFNHPQGIVGETMFRSPRPVWSSASVKTTIGDTFKLNSSLFSTGWANGLTVYLDYDRPPGYTGYSDNIPLRASNAAGTHYARFNQTVTGADGQFQTTTAVGTRATYLYKPNPGERMEITMSVKPASDNTGRTVMSINGEPIATHGSADSTLGTPVILGSPTDIDFIELANLSGSPAGHTMYLSRIVVVPYVIDPRKLRTWRWSGAQKKKWLAMYEAFLTAELPTTKAQREPSCVIFSRDGDSVHFGVFCFQRNVEADYHNEMPGRLMQRNFKYTYSTNQIVPETDPMVMFQDDRWAQKLGHTHSPTVFWNSVDKQWVCMFTHQDSASGTLSDDDRSIWVMVNKLPDCHPSGWGTPVKLYDARTDFGAGYTIVLSNCEALIFPPDHAVAPNRVCIPIYDSSNAKVTVIYSDTFGGPNGTDWTRGPVNTYSGPATNINEVTCSFWPDNNGKMGTAVYTWRCWNGAPQNMRVWGTSPDGINITFQGLIPNYEGSECSASTCQLDPDGSKTGTNFGRIVMARPEYRGSTNKPRQGARFSFFRDGAMTPVDEFYLFDSNSGNYRDRPFGYSSIKDSGLRDTNPGGTGGPICIYAVEGGSNGGQNDSNVYVLALPLAAS